MKVSAIVVTFNQHDLLRTCLRSVERAMDGLDGELIVVDNASTDATPDVVRDEFPRARIIRNPVNLYYTRAVNQGMRAATGEYAYLLNDDTELEPGNVRELVRFLDANPRCGVVGPALYSPRHEPQVSAQRFPTPVREVCQILGLAHLLRGQAWADPIQRRYPEPMGTRRVDWVCGGALFLRAGLMATLGHHDEGYLFYFDDPDVGRRMARAGYEVWYDAGTYVLHHHGLSTVKTPRRLRFDVILARSRRHYLRKFHGWLPMAAVEAAHAAAAAGRAARRLLAGRRAEAVQQWRALQALFEARRMPPEERDAIEGYRRCAFNGLGAPGGGGAEPGVAAR